MARYAEDEPFMTAEESRYEGDRPRRAVVVDDDTPLSSGLNRLQNQVDSLHKTIEVAFTRLEHLTFDAPSPMLENTEAKLAAAPEHSDTVLRVHRLASQIQSADERLLRLLRILEA